MNIIKFVYRYLGPIIAANALIEMTIAELTRLFYLHNNNVAVIIWPWLVTWVPYFAATLIAVLMYYVIGSQVYRKIENKLNVKQELMMWFIPIAYLLPMLVYSYTSNGGNPWIGVIAANLIGLSLIWHFLMYPLPMKSKKLLMKWAYGLSLLAIVVSISTLIIESNLLT